MKAYDVAYFAASVDDAETNKKFAESVDADYPVLSDPDKTVANAYGVIPEGRTTAARWTFYIGPDGRILEIDKNVRVQTAGEDIAKKLDELKVKKRASR